MLGVNDYNKINEFIIDFINGKKKALELLNYSDENINEGKRILTTQKAILLILELQKDVIIFVHIV